MILTVINDMQEFKRPPVSAANQKWLRIVILVIGTATFLCFLALSPILRSATKRDREGSPPMSGTGTIEQIVPPHIEENTRPIPAQVWVRINGTLAASQTVFGSAQLRVGGPALVTYRTGRSGRIYVDRVEPIPPPAGSHGR